MTISLELLVIMMLISFIIGVLITISMLAPRIYR
jgi:uncharacterized integral membrane protein